jgi:hypothetical protein
MQRIEMLHDVLLLKMDFYQKSFQRRGPCPVDYPSGELGSVNSIKWYKHE